MGPYTALHQNPQGVGDARPTALQIIKDQDLYDKLNGRVFVITGATSGIGLETARAISATGATLFLTARNMRKANAALKAILEPGRVSLVEMDHNSLQSVREAAKTILSESGGKVNILICNAGVMGLPDLIFTEDGYEEHFQINYLSHFLLFQLLRLSLLSSSTRAFRSRVVMVSSSAARSSTLAVSDNHSFNNGSYSPEVAYARSKLAQIYLANEIERNYGTEGLHATSLHPGAIDTGISRHVSKEFVEQIMSDPALIKLLKSPEQGAATTIIAALGKDWEDKGGRYLEDTEEARRGAEDGQAFGVGWVKHMYDREEEERLWKDSLQMVGMTKDL